MPVVVTVMILSLTIHGGSLLHLPVSYSAVGAKYASTQCGRISRYACPACENRSQAISWPRSGLRVAPKFCERYSDRMSQEYRGFTGEV